MPDAAGPRFRKNASPIRLRKDPAGVPRGPLTADVTGDDPRRRAGARAVQATGAAGPGGHSQDALELAWPESRSSAFAMAGATP